MKTPVSLNLDRATLDRLDAEAVRLDASRSYAVRRLLARALENPSAAPSRAASDGSPSRVGHRAAGRDHGGNNDA